MTAKVIRQFEEEHANGTTRRTLARNVDCVTAPRRGDRLRLPDLEEELPVEHATIVAAIPDRPPTPPTPRVIMTLGVESADRYARAVSLGWRTA